MNKDIPAPPPPPPARIIVEFSVLSAGICPKCGSSMIYPSLWDSMMVKNAACIQKKECDEYYGDKK
jgi:hypothetical protein